MLGMYHSNTLLQVGGNHLIRILQRFPRVFKNKGMIMQIRLRKKSSFKINMHYRQTNQPYTLHVSWTYFRPSTSNSAHTSYSQKLAQRENATRRSSLPRSVNKTAPETAIRLCIFASSDIINNLDEADLSASLSGIPVRLISTRNLSEFREKIEMVGDLILRFKLQ